eukprot:TRINITY_DN270_c0_g2_i1.p1 TRINITY_DN270_c0_g2~~TRINITY_DN270_c0_g2_i1.p1  ORF type:complete len:294 (-),score=84.00 TRINITY_DN270_c0_g2_i1:108-989(-)
MAKRYASPRIPALRPQYLRTLKLKKKQQQQQQRSREHVPLPLRAIDAALAPLYRRSGLGAAGVAGPLLLWSATAACLLLGSREGGAPFWCHFVSELGLGPHGWLFNYGAVAGGLCIGLFMWGVGRLFHSACGTLLALSGILSSAACACVGLFPLSSPTAHTAAATAFFVTGLSTALLAGLSTLTQRRPAPGPLSSAPEPGNVLRKRTLAWWLALLGCYVAFAVALVRARSQLAEFGVGEDGEINMMEALLRPVDERTAPYLRAVTILEWCVFFATPFSIFCVGLHTRRLRHTS